jgi:hypothetical protein
VNDQELDRLLRQAQPHTDAMVESLDLDRGGQELLEEIVSTPSTPQFDVSHLEPVELPAAAAPAPPSRRRRALIAVTAAAAFAAAIAGPTIVFRGGNDALITPGAYSGQARAVASSNPRLLIDNPDWKITHVDEFSADVGEIEFSNGDRRLEVHWYAADTYQDYYDDRLMVSKPKSFDLLGREGAQFTYSANDFAVMMPVKGKNFLEIRGGVGDHAAFAAVLAQLKQVSVEQWLAAMPASVVTPGETGKVAQQMLADVPLPAGFNTSKLPHGGTNDFYQFGAAVIGNVTCAWLKDYQSARTAGNEPGMAKVDEALGTSRTWKTLQQMNKDGDYPEVIWEFADRVHKREAVDEYQQALGCD